MEKLFNMTEIEIFCCVKKDKNIKMRCTFIPRKSSDHLVVHILSYGEGKLNLFKSRDQSILGTMFIFSFPRCYRSSL